jgi:hypothetical protein
LIINHKANEHSISHVLNGEFMGELIPLLEKLREVLDEMVKVVDGRIEKSEGEKRENYKEYRSILREMYGRLGELMNKMYIDRVLDPDENKALLFLILETMKAGRKQ